MSSDRRDFLGKAAAVTAALGAGALPLAAQRATTMPTPRASALMELFGLRYPIFSAGMGATAVPELAIAVSNAGGLGAIGTGRSTQCRTSCASASRKPSPPPTALRGELPAPTGSRHTPARARRWRADHSIRVGHSDSGHRRRDPESGREDGHSDQQRRRCAARPRCRRGLSDLPGH